MHYQILALAKERLVIAADSRAHGRSTDSEVLASYAIMADDMVKLLDNLKIDQLDVVGWSDGAIIGLDLAMHHPDRIRRLVAISANFGVDGLVNKPILDAKIPPAPGFYVRKAPAPEHWPVSFKREHIDRLAKAIPNSREDIIETGTHSVPFDQPDIINAHILRFLDAELP